MTDIRCEKCAHSTPVDQVRSNGRCYFCSEPLGLTEAQALVTSADWLALMEQGGEELRSVFSADAAGNTESIVIYIRGGMAKRIGHAGLRDAEFKERLK